MYIAQWIAKHTSQSRRSAVELVKSGRVTCNGRLANVTDHVRDGNVVCIDDKEVQATQRVYLMLNKPAGYVCSRTAQDDRPTVYELLPERYQHLTYAGRLDADSSGLLLMSNDGDWVQELTHPRFEISRVYEVELNRTLDRRDITALQKGVKLEDGRSQLSDVSQTGDKTYRVSLQEGRNRQIRRTFEALGYRVVTLHRLQHGDYVLESLAVGDFTEINR